MKLPFFHKSSTSQHFYGGIFLKEAEGMILLLRPQGNSFTISDIERFTYTDGWEHILEDVDEAIFRLEKRNKITINEAIFFVYSHFIDTERKEIKKPYAEKIKDIVRNLELKALGYIECQEAIARSTEAKDGAGLSAVVVEVDLSQIALHVYKGGKAVFKNTSPKTQDLVQDITHALEQIKGTMLLPTRIILYESKDIKEPTSRLFTHNWDTELFVQLPKIEVIKEEDFLRALTEIFQEQIQTEKSEQGATVESVPEQSAQEKESTQMIKKEIEDTGFVVGTDVAFSDTKEVTTERKPFMSDIRSNISSFFSKIKLPRGRISLVAVFVLGIVLFALAISLNEYYFHTASLRVFLPYSELKKNIEMTGSLKGGEIAVRVATVSAEFSESKTATGKKDVGEKAQGPVTIYNLEDKAVQLSSGTAVSIGEFSFTLDGDVTVPSATINDETNETEPGKAEASITAVEIGSESNLEKGKRFKIGELSPTVFYAINTGSLTGGSKKQIQTVSKKDIDDLTKTIETKAEKSTNLHASNAADSSFRQIDSLSKVELTNINATKEVGEEASLVKLSATAEKEMYSYDDNAVKNKILAKLKPEVKNGYTVEDSNISYTIKNAQRDDDVIEFSVAVVAKQTPVIDVSKVKEQLIFKTAKDVESLLKDTYNVTGYELSVKNPIPFLQGRMPPFSKNIYIITSSE